MNQAKTIWKNSLELQMTLFCHCGMNKARTIELNLRKIQNDPILPNPAKSARKNLSKFADDPILPLWMNQAKTIQWNPRIVEKCKRTLFWNPAETIGKNPLKLQMTLLCRYGWIKLKLFSWILEKIQNGPILPRYMNQPKTIRKNPIKLQMALFCRCGWIQLKPFGKNPSKIQNDLILPLQMYRAETI